jgi:hypothetical protein
MRTARGTDHRRRDAARRRWFTGTAACAAAVSLLPTAAWGQTAAPSQEDDPSAAASPDEALPRLLPAPQFEETPGPISRPGDEPRTPAPSRVTPPFAAPAASPPPSPPPSPHRRGALTGARLIVGIERTVGFAFWRSTLTAAPPPATGAIRISWDRETSSGHLTNVLASGSTYGELSEVAAPSLIPRLAADGLLFGGFTVGGAVGYFSSVGNRNVAGVPTVSAADPERAGVLVAPRVGYLLALRSDLTLWLRAGIAYASTTVNQSDETAALITREVWHLQASLDPAVVFSPAPHLGILLNPFLDLGVGGRRRVSVVDAQAIRAENHAAFRWSGYGLALAVCGFL